LRLVVDRAQLRIGICAVADLDGLGLRSQSVDDLVVHGLWYVYPLDGRADLPVVVEGAGKNGGSHRARVGVVQDDGRVVAPQLEGDAFEIRCGRSRHQLPGLDGSGEADLAGNRVAGHEGAELVSAADDVQHTGWQHVAQQLPHLEMWRGG
jgi:hypothetical protein